MDRTIEHAAVAHAERPVVDPLTNAYHVNDVFFSSALDWELAMSRAQEAAAESEARLRRAMGRTGVMPVRVVVGMGGAPSMYLLPAA